jgi:amino acid adenylation domain-containing protein
MYTSGSTGQPKGVMVEHGNVVHLVMDSNYARISAADCMAHCANPAFDAATWEIWAALLHGARVLVIDAALLLAPEQFCQALQAGGVTAMWLTVALLNQYVDALAPVLPRLNYLLFGGDRADLSTVRHVFQHCRPRHLVNGYGPTETTTFAVTYAVSALDAIEYGVPIGRPLQYAKVYILDQDLQPVPIGVTGEIYIGGAGVARGYLNQPELSATSFVADPFADPLPAPFTAPGAPARMYKSGDLGRWLPDGNIDYLGRNDLQVKIRGFRIELGEIEARLCACENVRDAVVIAREDTPGDKRLAAYLLADDEEEAFDPAELRRQLGKSLADYMIPSAFVTLTTFPLTANGKVNRKALPAPERDAAAALQYAAPEGPLETAIATLWEQVLHLPQVGRHDNFFELGGHSLLAVQLLSALRRTLHVEVALRDLFNQPTLAAFAEAVAQARAATMSAITRADRNAPLALSFAQQRLWFLDQLAPGTAFYNVPAAMRFAGTLDIDAFVRTLNEVVRRHESLRTSFATIDGAAVQIIAPALHIALPLTDLSALPQDEREARARALIIAEAQTPFDLATGPVLRAGLLRMADDDHILLFTLHHIVSDAWSLGILLRELSVIYAAFVRGLPSPLPPLALQYADFAQWQRQWLSGAVMAEQIDYWRAQLADAPLMLALPTDRPRPALQSYRGASLPFAISAELTAGLNALAQRNHATLFMTLLAAFNVLMARHAGQTDICVGTPIANRSRTEIEALIGFFVNTLVLRTRINLAASFETLLQQVRATALDAYAHQDAPFEQLVDALKPERHLGHTPLFQVVFILQTAAIGALDLDGMLLQPVASESATAKFDLTVGLSEADGQISGAFEYNTDLFDAATIVRMMGHFTELLRAIVAAPAALLGGLPLTRQAERHQLLAEWNDTASNYPKTSTIPQLFELQAAKTPDAPAVFFDETTLSYAELNSRANQLARHLRSMGVGPDVLVTVCIERNTHLIVSLLAILKAGGAYVPLDPAYPPERLAFMLEDAKPAVLLTQQHLLAALPLHLLPADSTVFCVDSAWDSLQEVATTNPGYRSFPGNLAYIIYTSGSTGKPKGVSGQMQALVNRITWVQKAFPCLPGEAHAQKTAINFLDSVTEVLCPLLFGGQLHIALPHTSQDPYAMWHFIKTANIARLVLVPSLLEALLGCDAAALCTTLGMIVSSGEALPNTLVEAARRRLPSTKLLNFYGSSEVAGDVTFHNCSDPDRHYQSIPLGRPIANTQIYILNADLEPTPIGVVGELYMAGDGLARGYLYRPDLTAERFIPNPFSASGERMYRSGDLGRYLPGGEIDYLGRSDDQVKIRGFRIELGEIEAALTKLPLVRECVVMARADGAPAGTVGHKRLVAYLVMQDQTNNPADAITDDAAQDTGQLSAHLRHALLQSLPDYMVPSFFIPLRQMPLNPNGKIDRKALPAPDMVRSELGYTAPGTADEITLAAIWAEVLGLDKVGIHDNFFLLGGHSLLVTQVISKLRAALGIDVPLRALFEAPTVAALAERVALARHDAAHLTAPAMPPITPIARDMHAGQESTPALVLSFAQQRLWFLDQLEPGSPLYNVPAAIRFSGTLDVAALRHTLNEVVRRHEALRTSFASIDGNAVQVIAPQLTLALPVTDLSTLPATEREARAQYLMHEEAKTPFNLATGPLLRASLLHLDQAEHIVLLSMHHIVSDGWSMGVLVREVAALYGAYVQHLPSPLPPLPIQYADFAHWQRQWLRGDVLAQQIDYWTRQLAQSPPLLALPTDRPRPAMQSFRGASLPFVLPAATTANLHALAQRMQATLFMTLMAGFNVLLARYTGQSDLCVGTPIANRNHADIEALIGFFVNTLVLRTQVKPEDSFETLLQQVRNTALGAYAHQDVPFEQLVDAIKPERHLDHAPLFQVMLALQNAPMTKLDLPGLRLLPLSSDSATAKFDLTVLLSEIDGQVTGVFEYNSDLFDAATITRMMAHFNHLLEAITRNPACPVGDLPLMAAAEQSQLLLEQAALRGIPPTLLMRDGAPAAARGYVLDPRRGLCPVGVAGELYLGGDYPALAQGADIDATLLPDPFNPVPGARMISTGECARVRPDGSFVLLGKLAAQIDLRGFRIEAGVVEAALLALPGVRQALVTMRDDAQDDAQDGKYLAAFLVLEADAAFDVAETHRLLMPNLPDYMAPTRFAVLDQFPLTPDGDIDRSVLPAPDLRAVKPVYTAPGTPTEIILAGLWAEALSVEQVGIHDSFFDLGGQSLLVVVAVNQIEQQFEVNLPIELFFQYKTIFLISRYIDDINAAKQASRNTNALPEGFSRIRI